MRGSGEGAGGCGPRSLDTGDRCQAVPRPDPGADARGAKRDFRSNKRRGVFPKSVNTTLSLTHSDVGRCSWCAARYPAASAAQPPHRSQSRAHARYP